MPLTVLSVAYPLARLGPDTPGGAEQVLSTLDAALAAAGHRSLVVAAEGSRCRGRLLATPAPGDTLDGPARARAIRHHRAAIAEALGRWPVDVVHLHGLDFADYLPASGPPVVATLHLPPGRYPPEVFRLTRPATYLACVSGTQLAACPDPARIHAVVPNGVAVERFPAARAKGRYVVALGRICPEKGFHLAADAARRAGRPLVLAGAVFGYRAHRAYFAEEILPRLGPDVRFVGAVGGPAKARLLAGARCLLAPSLVAETSSLVAMEALAAGTPVVAFRAGALAEVVEHGRTGFLVDGVAAMAEAIEAAGGLDPAECRRIARARHSARAMTARYLALYHEVAARAADGRRAPAPPLRGW